MMIALHPLQAFFGTSLGAGEILVVLIVALLLFGADKLPTLARSLGRSMEELRRAARDLRRDFMEGGEPNPPDPTPASQESDRIRELRTGQEDSADPAQALPLQRRDATATQPKSDSPDSTDPARTPTAGSATLATVSPPPKLPATTSLPRAG